MFGLPSLYTIIALATLPVLIGIALVNWRETWYNVAGFFFLCINTWFAISSYMTFMYDTWRGDNQPQPVRNNPTDEQPTQADPHLIPRIDYGQSTVRLKIDCISRFNQTLIDQHRGSLEVNLTENFWVKKLGGAEESRWVHIGGQGPTDWKDMMERGVRFGAYKEIGGQGKRVPDNWRKISQLAQGYPLPQ